MAAVGCLMLRGVELVVSDDGPGSVHHVGAHQRWTKEDTYIRKGVARHGVSDKDRVVLVI